MDRQTKGNKTGVTELKETMTKTKLIYEKYILNDRRCREYINI